MREMLIGVLPFLVLGLLTFVAASGEPPDGFA